VLWRIAGEEIPEDRTPLLGAPCLGGSSLEALWFGADHLCFRAQQLECRVVLLDLMVEGSVGEQNPELARHSCRAERRWKRDAGIDDYAGHSAPA
jgi:hypothetical protein